MVLRLLRKVDGKTVASEHEAEEGMATGKQVRRLLHVKKGEVLFSIDVWGHVQEKQGAIQDNEVLFVRPGREFFARNG